MTKQVRNWQILVIVIAALLLVGQAISLLISRTRAPALPQYSGQLASVRNLQIKVESGYKLTADEVKQLVQALRSDDFRVKVRALSAISYIKDSDLARSTLPYVRTTLKDPSPAVRATAIKALSRIGTQQDIQLLEPLKNDPEPVVRQNAERAIEILKRKLGSGG